MNKETIKAAREALDNLDDYARMNTGVNAIGPRGVLEAFISEAERTTSPDRQSCCAHDSDCAVHNAPALPVGPCDCSLAATAPHAQAPAEQQESIDGPEFQELVSDHASTYLDYSGSFAEERAMKTMKYLIEFIDAHTAAAVAKETVRCGELAEARERGFANQLADEVAKARAEAALAQPVDLSKLTRYGHGPSYIGDECDFGPREDGRYFDAKAVEQLLAAAPAAPVAEPEIDTAELAAELERQWLAKTIAEVRAVIASLHEGPFRNGAETALDEIEARCGKPAAQPQPVAEQGDLPRAIGVSRDAESPGMKTVLVAFERPLNDGELRRLHEILAASQQAAEPVAWPSNEELQALWDENHAGHPVDFAADVLERWGGCPAGLLGNGAAPAIQQPQDERAAFEAWAKYCGLRLDMATHQFAWEGWKARATAAEAKLEAIRQGVRECVGFGFDKDGPNWISRQQVLAFFQQQPQADESGLPG